MNLASKAIDKARKDGILSLVSNGTTWAYGRIYRRASIRYRSDVSRPMAKLSVDPDDVEYYRPSRFSGSYWNHFGVVKGGDWDMERYPIADHPKYLACKQRAEEGASWEETGVIDYMYKRLEQSELDAIEHGCKSRADLARLYTEDREALFQDMRANGYDDGRSSVCCRVHVARDGEIILASGGRHRLFFAKLLDVDAVPVRVLWRHPQWQSVREEVRDASVYDGLGRRAREHVDHPDLRPFVPQGWLD